MEVGESAVGGINFFKVSGLNNFPKFSDTVESNNAFFKFLLLAA